jgi:hypothetical protein
MYPYYSPFSCRFSLIPSFTPVIILPAALDLPICTFGTDFSISFPAPFFNPCFCQTHYLQLSYVFPKCSSFFLNSVMFQYSAPHFYFSFRIFFLVFPFVLLFRFPFSLSIYLFFHFLFIPFLAGSSSLLFSFF